LARKSAFVASPEKTLIMDFSLPAIIGLATSLLGGAPAPYDSTPATLLATLYAASAGVEKPLTADDVYSDRLQTLFLEHEIDSQITLASTDDIAPPVDLEPFDPLSLATAPQPVAISEPVVHGRQATATVTFDNASGPVQLSVFMIEQSEGWRIDDIASFDADGQPWLLSLLLSEDPYSRD
jgi:hypothetical protein